MGWGGGGDVLPVDSCVLMQQQLVQQQSIPNLCDSPAGATTRAGGADSAAQEPGHAAAGSRGELQRAAFAGLYGGAGLGSAGYELCLLTQSASTQRLVTQLYQTPGFEAAARFLPMPSRALQLSNGLLSLELSTTGSGELSAALSGSTLSEEGEMERAASEGTLPVRAL